MALTKKYGIRANWSLIIERPNHRERGEEEKREEEEEEEKKKRRERPKMYGTMTINMHTCFGLYGTTLDKDFFN